MHFFWIVVKSIHSIATQNNESELGNEAMSQEETKDTAG
jgi:hypothetical protein